MQHRLTGKYPPPLPQANSRHSIITTGHSPGVAKKLKSPTGASMQLWQKRGVLVTLLLPLIFQLFQHLPAIIILRV